MSNNSELWLKLIQVIASIETELAKMLQAKHGLGLTEYRGLEILARSPNFELRMQELATHLRLNQSSVSRMAERLELGGFTIRDICPNDKRGVYTVLTEKGRVQFDRARFDYENALDAALIEYDYETLALMKLIPKNKQKSETDSLK